MHDPHVVLVVDGDAGDLSEQLVVGQVLGPERVDHIARTIAVLALRSGDRGGDAEHGNRRNKERAFHERVSLGSPPTICGCRADDGTIAREHWGLKPGLTALLDIADTLGIRAQKVTSARISQFLVKKRRLTPRFTSQGLNLYGKVPQAASASGLVTCVERKLRRSLSGRPHGW